MSKLIKMRGGTSLITLSNGPLNVLSHSLRKELMSNLERAYAEKPNAILLAGDGNHFSAGLDIRELNRKEESPTVREIVTYLDTFKVPLIASIHGSCLSTALETVLACHWRVADMSVRLGFQESLIGVMPGAGGTQRFPRIVGTKLAKLSITDSRLYRPDYCLVHGIFDKIIPIFGHSGKLTEETLDFALSEVVQGVSVESRRVSSWPPTHDTKFDSAEEVVNGLGDKQKRAIFNAVNAAVTSNSFEEGMEIEARLLAEISKPSETRGTQYFYFNTRRFANFHKHRTNSVILGKAIPFLQTVKPPSIYPTELQNIIPKKFVNSVIVGGSDEAVMIAKMFILNGIDSTMLVPNQAEATVMLALIKKIFQSFSNNEKKKTIKGTIRVSTNFNSIKLADLIFHPTALYDDNDYDDKQYLLRPSNVPNFEEINSLRGPDSIMVVGMMTYGPTLEQHVEPYDNKASVVGASFFFPDVIRNMVEVYPSASTDATTVVSLMNLLDRCGKCPVLTGTSEGYLGYRLMDSMIKEAFFLVQEGVTPIRLDRIVRKRLGMRGPFDFLCNRGLKNALSYGLARTQLEFSAYKEELVRLENNPEEVFKPQPGSLPERQNPDPEVESAPIKKSPITLDSWCPELLNRMFYIEGPIITPSDCLSVEAVKIIGNYRRAYPAKPREITDDEIFDRLYFSLVNDALMMLDEGVALSADDIDLTYTRGLSLNSRLGGLLFHAEHTVGLPKIYKALKTYHETHSERYWLKPSKLLISVIESQATLKEEMYFRKQNKLEIQKQKEVLEKAAKEKAEIEKEETVTQTDSA